MAAFSRLRKPAGGKSAKPQSIALGGLLAALVFVATVFLKLPFPMAQGYIHLGDGFILLGAALLSFAAAPAAALGSLLADLLLGFVPYALPSLLIKGGMAAIAALGIKTSSGLLRAAIWALAEAFMVAGYFFTEWLALGMGFGGAWANLPGNAIQGLGGLAMAMLLLPMVRLIKPLIDRMR